jgi:ABC-type spermidine/putrescine transport system permease subunit II
MAIAQAHASPTRLVVIGLTALAVFLPLGLIVYQSLLDAPFFAPHKVGLNAFGFIFADGDFWDAMKNSIVIAAAMALIAVPLGGILAFLMIRTDLPGRTWIEPLLLIPVFVSPMVLGFGYVVAAGPVGFYSVWAKDLFGGVPWNVYSLAGIAVIAGLTHVPHVYLYSSSALKSLGSDVEEAARMAGSTPFQVARDVSLPMVTPALLFSGVLVFFLGFEIFGLPLVLGDPEGPPRPRDLSLQAHQQARHAVVPPDGGGRGVHHRVTFPLVMLQRYLLKNAGKFVTVRGKAGRQRPLPLGGWRWVAADDPRAVAVRHDRRSALGDRAARARHQLGRRRQARRGADARQLPRGDGPADARARHRQHRADRNHRRRRGRRVLHRGRPRDAPQERRLVALRRLPGAGAARSPGAARRPRVPLGVPLLPAALAAALDDLRRLDRLHGRLARLRDAARLELAAAGRPRARGGGAQRRREPRPRQPRRHAAADPLRPARELAARLHDLRARVLDRRLPARAGHRGDRVALVSLWGTGAAESVAALSFINVVLVAIGLTVALRFGVKLHD